MVLKRIASAFLFLTVPAAFLFAQADRGTITGLVTDPTGGVMLGVRVTATNVATGIHTETMSNEAGAFTIPNIPIGSYRVRFEAPGFKSFERDGLTITVAQKLRLDVVMEPGGIDETVTVLADTPILKTDDDIVGSTLQSKIITDLPLSFSGGRGVENFAYAVTPAVEGNSWTSYIAGGTAFSKEVLIDGVSMTSQISGHASQTSPTMEAVQEFKVQTSGMSAEYGHSSGGVFNFTLKSGTKDLHGSAYYYGRNEALNANSWMNNYWGSQCGGDQACLDKYQRTTDRQHLFGFSSGGPVYIPKIYTGRDRTFFFVAGEFYRQERLQLGPYNKTVPIPEFLNGDFSKLLATQQVGTDALNRPVYAGQIYDPATLQQVGGQWVADPFQGNVIPSGRISSVSKKITDIYGKEYRPMVPGVLVNNSATTLNNKPWLHQNQVTVKGDHNVTGSLKFSGSFIWSEGPVVLNDATTGGLWDPNDSTNTGGPLSRARNQNVTGHSARISNNWIVKPNLVNTFSFAFNRFYNPNLATSASTGDWPEFLGMGSSTSARNFPQIDFGPAVNGIGTTAAGNNTVIYYIGNTFIYSDGLNWIKGRHSMKFGGEFWAHQMNSHEGGDTLNFDFTNTQTGLPGYSFSNKVGFGFASFLLGGVSGAHKVISFDLYGRRKYWNLYFTDDFKVSKKLTLTMGLRWEQSRGWSEKYGRWANFNTGMKSKAYGINGTLEYATPGSTFEGPLYWKEFSPRLGASYQLSQKIVLRGGYGIFYVPQGLNYWSGVPYGFAPGYRGTDEIKPTGNKPAFYWDTGYPGNYNPPTQNPDALPYGVTTIDSRTLQDGYTHQYNFNIQFELTSKTVIEAGYVGNQGRKLHGGQFFRNQPGRAAYEDPNVNPYAWVWDAGSAASAGVPYPYAGFSGYAGWALQPYPQVSSTWGPLFSVGTPLGESNYNSFQISWTQMSSRGFTGQISYNLSRANGNTATNFDETWDATGGIQDQNALASEVDIPQPYDSMHIFKGYAGYELPFGKGKKFLSGSNGFVNAVLGGWNVTTIFRYNTGTPLGINPNVYYPGWEGAVYANYDASVPLNLSFNSQTFNPGNPASPGNNYFNTAAFTNPPDHKLGNGKRFYDNLRTLGFSTEDIGVFKYWRPTETTAIQFRAEFLNAFNRHHYGTPGTSIADTSTFGKITTLSGEARVIQFGLRLNF